MQKIKIFIYITSIFCLIITWVLVCIFPSRVCSLFKGVTLKDLIPFFTVLFNVILIAVASFWVTRRVNADIKRRELFSEYLNELKGRLRDLNETVMLNNGAPNTQKAKHINRECTAIEQIVIDLHRDTFHSEIRKLFYTLSSPGELFVAWQDYWYSATNWSLQQSSSSIQMDQIYSSHSELQFALKSWQMSLYFKTTP